MTTKGGGRPIRPLRLTPYTARILAVVSHGYAASDELAHDDVTFLLAEFVEGPPGPALWDVFKHRLLRLERR